MKLITLEQLQDTINVLAELPAKHSFQVLTMLQKLPDAPEDKGPENE